MGDAGPLPPDPLLEGGERDAASIPSAPDNLREIKVLVTGFGPFKSFLINPSWLIASALPTTLAPSSPLQKYKISLLVHPFPVRAAYATLHALIPQLVAQHDPDMILHIGMAGGRDNYSLETRANREGYRIKDVDERDGFDRSAEWVQLGAPEMLWTGWDEDDVLARWSKGVEAGMLGTSFLNPILGTAAKVVEKQILQQVQQERKGTLWGTPGSSAKVDENRRRGVVKLSRDAGRFVCEFALYTSLARRWLATYKPTDEGERSRSTSAEEQHGIAMARLGRVAFLHVPGWTGAEDVNRGVMVAEEAIKALVASWEEGYRRQGEGSTSNVALGGIAAQDKFTTQASEAHGNSTDTVAGPSVGAAEVSLGAVRMGVSSGGVRWRS